MTDDRARGRSAPRAAADRTTEVKAPDPPRGLDPLWSGIEQLLGSTAAAGLAVAVVHQGLVASRTFGVRDLRTREPVTPRTMFHLASVSKPFVAAAVVSLALGTSDRAPVIDLDAPITRWVPELSLADGRAEEVTARRLLSHTSGLPDVTDYGWHDPQLEDDALGEFARSLSGWRLRSEPGSTFAYSNAGYELLGLLLSRVTGTSFEVAMRQHVLAPLGMAASTFLRHDVPEDLAASPHVGMPLAVPDGAYPYSRRHAPSSTLHSNLVELCRWMTAHLRPDAGDAGPGVADRQSGVREGHIGTELVEAMTQPVINVGDPPWDESQTLGWAAGSYGGHRTLSHSGADPGFGSRLVLVPGAGAGVVVLANSNTVPTRLVAAAALDLVLADPPAGPSDRDQGDRPDGLTALATVRPTVVDRVATTLTTAGPDEAVSELVHLDHLETPDVDLDDEGFEDAVWGAIELHRTDLVWPLLRVWTRGRPESSAAWTMTGWAHQVDGSPEPARRALLRALDLDAANSEAAQLLGAPSGG